MIPFTSIGPYRLEALIGEGGMGIVYRAIDTKLNRAVAIKFLAEDLADAGARRRFQREAQTASSLNHPHILTVYDAGEIDDRQYLVTEFVDGGTLRDWLAAERRPWRQIVELLTGVADALAAAHAAGILHRDIKPENVLIARSGYAKLADFGLAKLDERSSHAVSDSALTVSRTRPGVIVGTIAYMSPEQAAGRPVDARSDIFSFGAMLYQAVAGRRPFGGVSDLEVMQTVMHGAAAPLPDDLPIGLRLAIEKALEKDPADRYQTIRELVVDLRRLARHTPQSTSSTVIQAPTPNVPRRPSRWTAAHWIAIAVAALAAGAGGWALRKATTPPPASRDVQVQRLTDLVGLEEAPALSPDGRTVAFVATTNRRRQIWVRLIAGGSPLQLTSDDADHWEPRWSPDSASLIYYTPGTQAGDTGVIWEIPALGGAPRRLMGALAPGDLSHDGKSLAFIQSRDGAIALVVAARDQSGSRTVVRLTRTMFTSLRWSPDDRWLAYIEDPAGTSFSSTLKVTDVGSGATRVIPGVAQYQGAAWKPDGSALIVSSAQGSQMPYPPTYNLWTASLADGSASQVTFGESSYEFPDVGAHGSIVVSRVHAQSDVWKFPVTGAPADNARAGVRITRQTGLLQTATLSPDEADVAVLSDNGGHANVWTAHVADGSMRPVTREFDPRLVVAVPVWSPRGDWINFLGNRTPGADVTMWLARPDGSEMRNLGVSGVWVCWSGDGEWVYFTSASSDGVYRIKRIRRAGGDVESIRDDDAVGCQVAPDGSGLYYARVLRQTGSGSDYELRVARPGTGPSTVIGTLSGTRVPARAFNFHALVSPDGRWLAAPLIDGATTNFWALPTTGGEWRKLTDFGDRNVVIARRFAWSKDSRSIYASVSDVDSDIVLLTGLK